MSADPLAAAIARQKLALKRSQPSTADAYTKSLGDYICDVCPAFPWTRHTTRTVEIGQRIVDGEIPRAMVEMPPRHFKSTIFSRFVPGYFLRRNPEKTFGLGAHNQTLASEFSEAARNYFVAAGGILSSSTSGKERWKTGGGMGGMWTAGVGYGTGLPADFLGVDDPIKGREEAESAAYRRRLQNWWSTVLNTREEPGGIKLITHTRWSEADLIGWLLKQVEELDKEGNGDAAEPWHVITMPIIAEPIIKPLPRLVTRETDDRLPGMALDPTRYDEEWARKKKLNTPDRDWEALYQQRPSAGEGTVFKASTFRFYVTEERMRDGEASDLILPKHFLRRVCSVDCNFKDSPGTDMVAFTLWGQNDIGMWLLDMINQRLDFPATVDTIRAMAPVWKFSELLVEDKANGSAVISTFKREAINYLLHECNPIGGKEARANAASVEFKNGRVIFPRHAPWLPEYTGQILKFPADDYDDIVDSTTQALNYVAGSGQMTVTTVAWGHSAEPVNDDEDEEF